LIVTICLGVVGCTERLITITSQPAGALVHLNDEEIGRTPVTVPFTFYGTYDVRLEAEGYRPLWSERKANAPLWDQPGIDLFAELRSPTSHIKWHFEMELEGEVDETALIERANELGSRMSR